MINLLDYNYENVYGDINLTFLSDYLFINIDLLIALFTYLFCNTNYLFGIINYLFADDNYFDYNYLLV